VIRVSSLDAGMLYAETAEMPMHVLGVVVIEPPRDPPFEVMRRVFAERIHLLAPLRRRLVQGPLKLGDPHWIEDPDFDLDNHLRRAAIPSPGGLRELAEFVGEVAGRPLERTRPLWEVVLAEGVEDGQLAIVVKIHHAAMDGGRAVGLLLGCLFDRDPADAETPAPGTEWTPEHEPTLAWFAADTARSLAAKPYHALRAVGEVASTVLGKAFSSGGEPGAARLFEAPATPFNGALTPHRSVALADVAFDDLQIVKRAFGSTINDVVLAASCAALRSWLLAHGGLPDRPLVANVPVAVRTADQEDAGNRVSVILVHLPVQADDPLERLTAIQAETHRAKRKHGRQHGDVLQQFTDVLTNLTVPWLLIHLMELYSSTHVADRLPPLWNVVVSNLPGPPGPLVTAGARVRKVYPLGPVQQGSGLNLTVLSTGDRLCLGVMACKELVPDVGDIGTGFVHEIAVLKGLALEKD
jgi:WS/DGAT/MGAT family acyltransferase